MKFQKLYNNAPVFIQSLMISGYNYLAYKKRYGKHYPNYLRQYKENRNLSIDQLEKDQSRRYTEFVNATMKHSPFYSTLFKNIIDPTHLDNIRELPIVDKEILRQNLADVHTITKEEAVVSKTGGTTGKSLEVYFTKNDMQERFGMLDAFRASHGYKLGKRTAWFSGKTLLTARDIRKKRFWKQDFLYNVMYYSTFHIQSRTSLAYLNNLIKFEPEFIVGFPSSILDIANFGLQNNIDFPPNTVSAIFPTAENVDDHTREILEKFFKTKVYDQYASSEGAPFIMECANQNLHLELQSGVFEVLDDNNKPAKEGRLIVTSFTTHGTPLIRYDIGDRIKLSDDRCSCGNNNPLVEKILGRSNDFLYVPEIGKINLGNLSNTLKDVNGVVRFQVVQNTLDTLEIYVQRDEVQYTKKDAVTFVENLRERVGNSMELNINYIDEIPREHSGKYRMIKNNCVHLIA
ncbi:phenylacetate--CoA ligase family protein [Dokdonia sinensis]|uniref:Phenylacetate--CoA ligase family protein n=1 Tax=Dokdonia sinensis TaxID=2479847 RepID=A0A3M0GQ58_9FLAO|nr:phenylacetate--CoA ligase family protein [Dokdonia sinensis]RMB63833.1 phenylacetate--CoA ligase family protein [Dokdonia sinensis]